VRLDGSRERRHGADAHAADAPASTGEQPDAPRHEV